LNDQPCASERREKFSLAKKQIYPRARSWPGIARAAPRNIIFHNSHSALALLQPLLKQPTLAAMKLDLLMQSGAIRARRRLLDLLAPGRKTTKLENFASERAP